MTYLMHRNSIEAYEELRNSLNHRQDQILALIERKPHSTDREILANYGGIEMNQVRPRITELIEKKLVKETGSKKCLVTKRKVRTLKAIDYNNPAQLNLQL